MRAVIGKNGTVSTVERQRMWLEELNRKHILYFGCHTGLGKTCQAELLAEKHYKVWRRIDAAEQPVYSSFQKWMETAGESEKKLCIIDKVSYLKEKSEAVRDILKIIQEEMERHKFDLIIAGRAECPAWLRGYRFTGKLKCYGKEHFLLGQNEILKLTEYELGYMAQRFGEKSKEWLKDTAQEIEGTTQGFAFGTFLCMEAIKENGGSRSFYGKIARQLVWEHFEKNVLPYFDGVTCSCLQKISVYESFTESMALELLNDEEKEAYLHIFDYCSFIENNGDDGFVIQSLFRLFMRKQYRTKDEKGFFETATRAGQCCEKEHLYAEAMHLYKICNNKKELERVLLFLAMNAEGSYFARLCESYTRYYLEEDYKGRPDLMAAKILADAYHMRVEQSDQRLDELCLLAEREKTEESGVTCLKSYLMAALRVPQRQTEETVRLIEKYHKFMEEKNIMPGILSVTGGGPSIINGGLDLMDCFRTKTFDYYIKKLITVMPHCEAEGVEDVACAEYFLEKNERMKAIEYLMSRLSDIRERGDFRTIYVASAVMARGMLEEGKISSAKDILDGIRGRIARSGYPETEENIKATKIELLLYEGTDEYVAEWMEDAYERGIGRPLSADFFISEVYQMYILAKVYVAFKRNVEAAVIIHQLRAYAVRYQRTYYQIKLSLLEAILLESTGEDGTGKLKEAVLMAAEYGYIRVIADEGEAIFAIWKHTDWKAWMKKTGIPDGMKDYFTALEKALKSMAEYYPDYLKKGNQELRLSKCEDQVMNYIYHGKKNEEIAQEMSIQLSTVKFHVGNIYKKLQVKNRQAAIRKAEQLGWYR